MKFEDRLNFNDVNLRDPHFRNIHFMDLATVVYPILPFNAFAVNYPQHNGQGLW